MQVRNETSLLHAMVVTSRQPPTPEMVVVVRGSCKLAHGEVMQVVDGMPQLVQGAMTSDVYRDDDEERVGEILYPSDFAHFKKNAEIMFRGSCHTPRARALPECPVRLSLGRWAKGLRVLGPRKWTYSGRVSKPESFIDMPLDYAHAFGGPDYPLNPVGTGAADTAVPNVEMFDAPIKSQDEHYAPASYTPINPAWPQRANKLGKDYGELWKRTRAPYFSADFDWGYFHAAPMDQQLKGYLKGDELLSLVNLNPREAELETRLPGIRVRVFVTDDRGNFREVEMKLDTLYVDGDAELVTLTWRGLTPVRERDLTDMTFGIVATEAMADRPLAEEVYRAQMDAFEADPVGVQNALREALGDMPTGEQGGGAADNAVARMLDDKGVPMNSEVRKLLSESIEQVTAAAKPNADVTAKLEELTRKMEEAASDVPAEPPPAIPAAAGGRARTYFRPQWLEAKEELAKAKADVAPNGEVPEHFLAAEKRLQDPKLRELDPTLREPTTEQPGPGADLSGQDLSGQDLRAIDLTGAKLDGCVLIDTKLGGARLAGCSLQGAMLFKADLSYADLTGANLSLCNAAYANLTGVNLSNTTLDDSYLANANLSEATLDGAKGKFINFAEANLTGARARGLQAQESTFDKATLTDAVFKQCLFDRCHFIETQAAKASFEGSDLPACVFLSADLTGACLAEARGKATNWLRATLDKADFRRCCFRESYFTFASANLTRFSGADLRESNFYRASLHQANFSRSNLFGADLSSSSLRTTKFIEANMYEAILLDTEHDDSDFTGATMTRSRFKAG